MNSSTSNSDAMKKFCINILVFSILLMIPNCIFYSIVDSFYWKPYEKKVKLNFKSYLLSDSHGMPLGNFTENYGIYNFSASSDSYDDMYIKAKYLIKNSAVSRILVTVDDHTLSPYREKMNNADRSVIYTDVSDYDSYYEYLAEKYIKRYIVYFNPKCRSIVRGFLKAQISSLISGVKSNGNDEEQPFREEENWTSLTTFEQEALAKKRSRDQFPNEKISKPLTKKLEDIIALCRENNIELIGLKFPLTNDYLDVIDDKSFYADSIFRSNNIKIHDFKYLFSGNDSVFSNQDHLNKDGGRKFAKILKDTLKS